MKNLFGGKDGEEQNALYTALIECGCDNAGIPSGTHEDSGAVYDYLEDIPRTSLIVELVNKLHELGFKIIKQ